MLWLETARRSLAKNGTRCLKIFRSLHFWWLENLLKSPFSNARPSIFGGCTVETDHTYIIMTNDDPTLGCWRCRHFWLKRWAPSGSNHPTLGNHPRVAMFCSLGRRWPHQKKSRSLVFSKEFKGGFLTEISKIFRSNIAMYTCRSYYEAAVSKIDAVYIWAKSSTNLRYMSPLTCTTTKDGTFSGYQLDINWLARLPPSNIPAIKVSDVPASQYTQQTNANLCWRMLLSITQHVGSARLASQNLSSWLGWSHDPYGDHPFFEENITSHSWCHGDLALPNHDNFIQFLRFSNKLLNGCLVLRKILCQFLNDYHSYWLASTDAWQFLTTSLSRIQLLHFRYGINSSLHNTKHKPWKTGAIRNTPTFETLRGWVKKSLSPVQTLSLHFFWGDSNEIK